MSVQQRRNYDQDFKRNAVRLTEEPGRTVGSPDMKFRNAASLLAINILVLLGVITLLEVGTRLLVNDTQQTLFADKQLRTRGRPFVEPHKTRGFALIPGFYDELYTIDKSGFRAGLPALAGAKKLIAVGESTTFGWEVGNDQTYPVLLQNQATAEGLTLNIVNAGVPSYSSTQVLLYIQEILSSQTADGLLVNIMWNDIWYSTVLNWYPDLLVYQQPPLWLCRVLRYSSFLRLIMLKGKPPSGKAVDLPNERALTLYRSNLEAMLELAREKGIPFSFVEPPFCPERVPEGGLNEFQVRYTRPFLIETANRYRSVMFALAEKYHVPVLGHRFSLANGGGPKELFIDLLHPNAEGNELMAQDLLKNLRQNTPLLPTP